MASTDRKSVDDYIAAQSESSKVVLTRVRKAIRKALPTAEETISYKIPAYRIGNKTILYFAGWKTFYSLYPAGPRLIASFKGELASCRIKGFTLQFPLSGPVPEKLIARIAKFRAEELAAKTPRRLGKKR